MTNMTAADLMDRYFELTEACEDLAREIRKGDHQTAGPAIAQFRTANGERVKLMRLLNLVPYGM